MKIAIVTKGKWPLPSVNGGGVETLVDTILSVNENKGLSKIDIYSVYNNEAKRRLGINECRERNRVRL